MTAREDAMDWLASLLAANLTADVVRNAYFPERIPANGLVIVRDGDQGEPEVTMSPLVYHFEHRADLEVFVQAETGTDAALDAILAEIGTVIEGNRAGGPVEWCEPGAVAPADVQIEGSEQVRACIVPVTLFYSAAGSPLGASAI